MRKIDASDRKLLRAVQENAHLTADQLGEACGLSPTAALKRLKRLRADRVIEKETATVDPRALGLNIMALVLVTLEREDRNVVDRFAQSVRATPQITQSFYITGDADFALIIVARDMEEYDEFTREFFYDRHRIKNFKTCVVMKVLKTGMAIPIPDA